MLGSRIVAGHKVSQLVAEYELVSDAKEATKVPDITSIPCRQEEYSLRKLAG